MTLDEYIATNARSPEEAEAARRRARSQGMNLSSPILDTGREPESSGYRRAMHAIQDFDIGKTVSGVITPAVAKFLEVATNYGPFTAPLKALTGTTGPVATYEGAKRAAEFVVPQDTAGWIAATTGPAMRGAGYLATGGRHVLGPMLGTGAGLGAIGGAEALKEGGWADVPWGVLWGITAGAGSEAGLAGGAKVIRSLPGMARRIEQSDLGNVVTSMVNSVPLFKTLAAARGRNLTDPATLAQMAKQGELLDALNKYARVGEVTISDRIGNAPVIIPALGGQPRTFAQAWKELSDAATAGYAGGKKVDPNLRNAQGLTPREVWRDGTDQMMQSLLDLDKTGGAVAAFDELRRVYGTGRAYINIVRAPGTIRAEGERPSFDPLKTQKLVRGKVGQLEHRDAFGNIAGGQMARPERTYRTYETVPLPALGPGEIPPPPVSTAQALPPISGPSVQPGSPRPFVAGVTSPNPPAEVNVPNPRRALPPPSGASPEISGAPRQFEPITPPPEVRVAYDYTRGVDPERTIVVTPQPESWVPTPSGPPTRMVLQGHGAPAVPPIPEHVTLSAPRPADVGTVRDPGRAPVADRAGTGERVPPLVPPPPPPGVIERGMPGGEVRMVEYHRPASSEFTALEDALYRGAGYGAQDYSQNLGFGYLPSWAHGIPRFLSSLVLLPNLTRGYVGGYGRIPISVPPNVQSGINYGAFRVEEEARRRRQPEAQ